MVQINAKSLFTKSQFSFGEQIPGLELYGRPAPYHVMNERAVRATAGLMLLAEGAEAMTSNYLKS